jgi:hypothetical protein
MKKIYVAGSLILAIVIFGALYYFHPPRRETKKQISSPSLLSPSPVAISTVEKQATDSAQSLNLPPVTAYPQSWFTCQTDADCVLADDPCLVNFSGKNNGENCSISISKNYEGEIKKQAKSHCPQGPAGRLCLEKMFVCESGKDPQAVCIKGACTMKLCG